MSEHKAFRLAKEWLFEKHGIENLEAYSQEMCVLMHKLLAESGAELVCYKLPGRGLHWCVATRSGIYDPTIGYWDPAPEGTHPGHLFTVMEHDPHNRWKEVEFDLKTAYAEADDPEFGKLVEEVEDVPHEQDLSKM